MATALIWDYCQLDDRIASDMASLQELLRDPNNSTNSVKDTLQVVTNCGGADSLLPIDNSGAGISINEMNLGSQKSALSEAESTCKTFLTELDELLALSSAIASSHLDVTGRTNNLILSCENLLEQQVLMRLY